MSKATDETPENIICYLIKYPDEMTINNIKGNISWTPKFDGDYDINVSVTDGELEIIIYTVLTERILCASVRISFICMLLGHLFSQGALQSEQ